MPVSSQHTRNTRDPNASTLDPSTPELPSQWRHAQSQGLRDPYGPGQSLWYLDGTAPQSFLSMSG